MQRMVLVGNFARYARFFGLICLVDPFFDLVLNFNIFLKKQRKKNESVSRTRLCKKHPYKISPLNLVQDLLVSPQIGELC